MIHANRKIFEALFALLFLTAGISFAQLEVEYNEITGELTAGDKFKSGFGRYDGYAIPLYEGELVNFVLYSESFIPRLVLVDAAGKVVAQSEGASSSFASLAQKIPSSGQWIVYVVGDSNSTGKYLFQTAFASASSASLKPDADNCTKLGFLLAHAKAYFLLLENAAQIKLFGSDDSFIDEELVNFETLFSNINDLKEAENLLEKKAAEVQKCLGKNWRKSESYWKSEEDFKFKSVLFNEGGNEIARSIELQLRDLRNSKLRFTSNFVLRLIVGRK